MKRIATVLLVLMLLAGCASTNTPIVPTPGESKSYEIGQMQTATIGSPMLRAARSYTVPTFTPVESYEVKEGRAVLTGTIVTRALTLQPGPLWEAVTLTEEGKYVIFRPLASSLETGSGPRLIITPDGVVEEMEGSYHEWPDRPLFEEAEPDPKQGPFEFELVYTGRSGDTISLLYREYFDGMARAAFSQKLSYDLAESEQISFRTIDIDVLEATNSNIRYRVTGDEDLPWLAE